MPAKINTLIIGAQKAGSSSLFKYLSSHKDINSHDKTEEFPYFSDTFLYDQGIEKIINTSFSKPFTADNNKHILCKSASVLHTYTSFKRIYNHNPNIQLICVLRNPVNRAFSAFAYAKRCGWEKRESFSEAIRDCSFDNQNDSIEKRNCNYLFVGEYMSHVNKLLEYFPKEQLKVILFDDLVENTKEICWDYFANNDLECNDIDTRKIHNRKKGSYFLSITKFLLGRNSLKKYLKKLLPFSSKYKLILKKKIIGLNEIDSKILEMDNETKNFLINHYKSHNLELSKFLKVNLSHWDL